MPRQPASVAVGLSGRRLAAALAVMSPASRLPRIAMHASPPDTWKRPLSRGRLQPGQHMMQVHRARAGFPRPRLRLIARPAARRFPVCCRSTTGSNARVSGRASQPRSQLRRGPAVLTGRARWRSRRRPRSASMLADGACRATSDGRRRRRVGGDLINRPDRYAVPGQRRLDLRHRVLAVVEDRRAQHGVGAGVERVGQMLERSRAARGDHRDADRAGDR